eukprot:2655669-Pyramimonas_sp.AAC.1
MSKVLKAPKAHISRATGALMGARCCETATVENEAVLFHDEDDDGLRKQHGAMRKEERQSR